MKGFRCAGGSGDIPLMLGYQKSGAAPTASRAEILDRRVLFV